MTDPSYRAVHPAIAADIQEAIGDLSIEHIGMRLACLQEAREQANMFRQPHYAELLFRARLNARFVLLGQTPVLRLKKEQQDELDAIAGKESVGE